MNKFLSYINLSLEFHVVSTFWLGSGTSGPFFYILPSHHMNFTWETSLEDTELTFVAVKLPEKVSLMLDNPFAVPFLCKLNHISLCFIQISTKITCKQLILIRESYVFLEVIPVVLGHSVNFNITEISNKTALVSRLSISCDCA